MNMIDLQGRKAIVTGAARGIGRAIAERLLQSGASVAIWDMDEAEAKKTAAALGKHGETLALQVDVTDEASVKTATEATRGRFGRIDILVNSVTGQLTALYDDPFIWRGSMFTDEQITGVNWEATARLNLRIIRFDEGDADGMFSAMSSYRFIADRRVEANGERLNELIDPARLYRRPPAIKRTPGCPQASTPAKAMAETQRRVTHRAP